MKIESYADKCPNRFNGRKGNIPDVIVFHNTGGKKISSAHHWFLNAESQTSAHFLVGLDGEVRQYVNLADGAWCNGTSSDRAAAHYYGNAESGVVRTRPQNANLYTVSAEFVGDVGSPLTKYQDRAAVELTDFVLTELERIYGFVFPLNSLHVISHGAVAPLTRRGCGDGIDIESVIRRVSRIREERAYRKTIGYARRCGMPKTVQTEIKLKK